MVRTARRGWCYRVIEEGLVEGGNTLMLMRVGENPLIVRELQY
jgi:MOSC domain-containing protein YiiM